MALNCRRGSAHRHRFNYIRVESSLHQKAHAADAFCFFFKDFDENRSDSFALRFRIDDLLQGLEEALACVNALNVQFQFLL